METKALKTFQDWSEEIKKRTQDPQTLFRESTYELWLFSILSVYCLEMFLFSKIFMKFRSPRFDRFASSTWVDSGYWSLRWSNVVISRLAGHLQEQSKARQTVNRKSESKSVLIICVDIEIDIDIDPDSDFDADINIDIDIDFDIDTDINIDVDIDFDIDTDIDIDIAIVFHTDINFDIDTDLPVILILILILNWFWYWSKFW